MIYFESVIQKRPCHPINTYNQNKTINDKIILFIFSSYCYYCGDEEKYSGRTKDMLF
jgi:hypothetical protein